jgi:hypothetical protein
MEQMRVRAVNRDMFNSGLRLLDIIVQTGPVLISKSVKVGIFSRKRYRFKRLADAFNAKEKKA